MGEMCILSLTDYGQQTDKSLSEWACLLINDLIADGIEWPVVIMTDGHASRKGPLTTDVCRPTRHR